MSYLAAGGGGELAPEQLALLCRLLGLPLPEGDAAGLAEALRGQLSVVEEFDRLPLDEIAPAFCFDPRWPEADD